MEPVTVAIIGLLAGLGGALIGGAISIVTTWLNNRAAGHLKRQELERRDLEIAQRCAEMKHQQLLAAQDWTIKTTGNAGEVVFWDPLQATIEYLDGLREYRDTGVWKKGKEVADARRRKELAAADRR